jgi:hypothetical protein
VSLASVNVPTGKLTKEAVLEALGPYADLLDEPNVVAGVFSFSKDGIPTTSIDVNAVVSQKYRDNTLDFAKQNDQVAIWDPYLKGGEGDEVSSGGKGNTRLKSLGELADAHQDLVRGVEVEVDEIIRQNAKPGVKDEQGLLDVVGAKVPAHIATMTKQEIADHYPESVQPRRRNEPIPSEVVKSPLYKDAGSEEGAIAAFARKIVEFSKEYRDTPEWKAGIEWYSKFSKLLKGEFKADSEIMAELLAANSPQNNPEMNFAMAYDAYQMLKSGKYEKKINKFGEALRMLSDGSWEKWYSRRYDNEPTENRFLAQWTHKYGLKPTQSNGKLLGKNSYATLLVLGRIWRSRNRGLKTTQFVQNLLGEDHGATIDVWADRTMRRIGYAPYLKRWRILPKNGEGVSDPDFLFSQRAFAKAAEEMGLLPDALQGGLWFAEKKLWADQGWGYLDLGSFSAEMEKIPAYKSSFKLRLAGKGGKDKTKIRSLNEKQARVGASEKADKGRTAAFDLTIPEVRRKL